MSLNQPTNEKKDKFILDEKRYTIFNQVWSFQAYEYLDGEKQVRQEQKDAFIAWEIESPTLDYPKITEEVIAKKEQWLVNLKKQILEEETNEVVKQIYRWKINEKLAEARMLRAVIQNNMPDFKKYTEFIYGKPSEEVFWYTLQSLHQKLQQDANHENTELSTVVKKLLNMLPPMRATVDIKQLTLPTPDTVAKVHDKVLSSIAHILRNNSQEPKVTYQDIDIKQAFETALYQLQINWRTVIVDSESSKSWISVNHESMAVVIPEGRTMKGIDLNKLIAHEIGTHVARREKWERSKLQLLWLWLDRYEQWEEWLATMREQLLDTEIKDFSWFDGHFAIWLAYGIWTTKKSFREVYDILHTYFTYELIKTWKSKESAEKAAQTKAWNRTVRTFRGTDCKTPWVCFTKDMIYREGNVWTWFIANKNPELFNKVQVGKYDIANPRHIWVLDQLGINEDDI